MDVEHSLLAGADVRMATDVGEDMMTGFIILNCLTPVTQMKAHTPYVIRWNGATDIVNPVFDRVIVLYDDPDADTNGVYLYDKNVKLGANYQCFDYSGSNTSFYKMIDGNPLLVNIKTGDTLYAFDGYFWFNPEVFAERTTFILNTGDDPVLQDRITGIADIQDEASRTKNEQESAVFNLAGQRLQKPQRGVNIVAGKKILVK